MKFKFVIIVNLFILLNTTFFAHAKNISNMCRNTIGIGQSLNQSLQEKKTSCTILSYHTIKPINFKELQNYIKNFKKIVIIEEHSVHGGLSSTIKNYFYKILHNKKIISICAPDLFFNGLGEQHEARNKLGFSTKSIIKKIQSE